MPFHLAPLTRRQFLIGSAAIGAGLLAPPAGAAETDPNRWALLADTHIAADPLLDARGINMAANLRRVAAEVTALNPAPAGLIVNGDCAFGAGLAGDYVTLGGLLKPFSEAGLPVHLALGNHDHRDNFRTGVPAGAGAQRVLETRHVSVIESRRANWFILDSLDQTNVTPGRLGDEQRAWLAEALDQRRDRPALVICHHHPVFDATEKIAGLLDTQELYELLAPRMHVKALIFGHTHHWDVQQKDGLYLINLPPVAYIFRQGDPAGWVDIRLTRMGAVMELRALDPAHPAHGKQTTLEWRAGSEDDRLLPVGKIGPDFTLPLLGGGEVTLANLLKTSKAVLLDFWAVAPEAGGTDLPLIQKVLEQFQEKGLSIVTVNPRDSSAKIQRFVDEAKVNLTIAIDGKETNQAVTNVYRARKLPTLYLLDSGGKVLWRNVGLNEADLREALAKAGFK